MNSFNYPSPIKTWLKAAPALVCFLFMSALFCDSIYDQIHHAHDRIEKFSFKSSEFQKRVRNRDDILRLYYKPQIEWQPNSQPIIQRQKIDYE